MSTVTVNSGMVEQLSVTLQDLMPAKHARVVTLDDERLPYVVSERLSVAVGKLAAKQGVTVATIWRQLRDEINGTTFARESRVPETEK